MIDDTLLAPLDKYLADLRKGFELTRRLVKPLQVKKTIATLSSGTTEQITFLFKDVCGEALSVAAGPFKKGGEAISAFVRSEERREGKECVIRCRSRCSPYN